MMANRAVLALRALLTVTLESATLSLDPLRSAKEWNSARSVDREAFELLEKRMFLVVEEVAPTAFSQNYTPN